MACILFGAKPLLGDPVHQHIYALPGLNELTRLHIITIIVGYLYHKLHGDILG